MGLFDLFRKKESEIDDYQRELDARRTAQPSAPPAPAVGEHLLQVEDVFAITGRGTVVTGQCRAPIAVQDAVVVVNPDGSRHDSVVTGLEKFRSKLDRAEPGDNVGVLLRGLSRSDVQRGAFIVKK